jgi:glutathione S-transferase
MGIPYEVVLEQFGAPSDAFKEANPLRSFPAIQDGDVTMTESIAILMYLMAKHGPTPLEVKADEPAFARYLQFMLFGEAGIAMYGNPLVATKYICPEDQGARRGGSHDSGR